MAASDYRLCDVCGGKAFYDAHLNYDQGNDVQGSVRNAGQLNENTRLDYLGDWAVICEGCAETHECRVVPKALQSSDEPSSGEAERDEAVAHALSTWPDSTSAIIFIATVFKGPEKLTLEDYAWAKGKLDALAAANGERGK